MTNQTPEEADRAQQQIEDVARLAAAVQWAVQKLEDEYCGLSDFPEALAKAMPRLSAAAKDCAAITSDWAKIGNADWHGGNDDNDAGRARRARRPL